MECDNRKWKNNIYVECALLGGNSTFGVRTEQVKTSGVEYYDARMGMYMFDLIIDSKSKKNVTTKGA